MHKHVFSETDFHNKPLKICIHRCNCESGRFFIFIYVLKNHSTLKQKRYLPHFTDRHIKSLHEIRPYLKFKC